MLLCQPAPRRRMDWRNWLLLASSVTIALLIAEFVFRYLPLGDMAGWSMVAPVAERAAAVPPKGGRTRIVALGDSFTEWRDNTGHSFVRVAERLLPSVEMVNLGESGNDVEDYFGNFLQYGRELRPDLVLIGLYLGNDLVPSVLPLDTAEGRAAAAMRPPPGTDWQWWSKRSVM